MKTLFVTRAIILIMVSRAGTLCQSFVSRELSRSRGEKLLTVLGARHDIVERNDHLVHHIRKNLPEFVRKWPANALLRRYIRVAVTECILCLYHLETRMSVHTRTAHGASRRTHL